MAGRKKAVAKKAPPGRNASGEQAKGEFLAPRPISLRTLGDYLDLSPATISLVLNNAPGVRRRSSIIGPAFLHERCDGGKASPWACWCRS